MHKCVLVKLVIMSLKLSSGKIVPIFSHVTFMSKILPASYVCGLQMGKGDLSARRCSRTGNIQGRQSGLSSFQFVLWHMVGGKE